MRYMKCTPLRSVKGRVRPSKRITANALPSAVASSTARPLLAAGFLGTAC